MLDAFKNCGVSFAGDVVFTVCLRIIRNLDTMCD